MIELRVMAADDVAAIQNWPPYPPEFEDLDYALRDNGWLAEFRGKPDTLIHVAEHAGEVVAFTILSRTGEAEAEFRIALRADMLGRGMGKIITPMTLEKGFVEMQLACIRLIVRSNNPRAIRLYQRIGFTECGECLQQVNGKLVNFLAMEISSGSYARLSS